LKTYRKSQFTIHLSRYLFLKDALFATKHAALGTQNENEI